MQVGFVGLGAMGEPMAANLMETGAAYCDTGEQIRSSD